MGQYKNNEYRLISMFVLTGMYFVVEITVGYVTNSMSLVADSFHMLGDVAALVVAFISVKISPKKWSKNTFGFARAEVLGALVNAVFLVALCLSILVEAIKRFMEVEPIHNPELIAGVGAFGLLVNLIGLFLLHEHAGHSHGGTPKKREVTTSNSRSHARLKNDTKKGGLDDEGENTGDDADENSGDDVHKKVGKCKPVVVERRSNHGHSHGGGGGGAVASQMNLRGVFLHVLADAIGSVIVVISALVIWLTDWTGKFYIDPALSLISIVVIFHTAWPLLRESALILLQTVPKHIQVDAIQRRLLEEVDGVLAVHELHVWQLTGDKIIASAHIRCRNMPENMKLAGKVKEVFHKEGIHSTTIQLEFVEIYKPADDMIGEPDTTDASCALKCPKSSCFLNSCCGPSQQGRNTPSPADSPCQCRQRCNSSRQQCDMESGRLLSPADNADDSSNTAPQGSRICQSAI